MAVTYRWATLGCGVIGHQLAEAMQKLGGRLNMVATTSPAHTDSTLSGVRLRNCSGLRG